jgi:hypothetical protein
MREAHFTYYKKFIMKPFTNFARKLERAGG